MGLIFWANWDPLLVAAWSDVMRCFPRPWGAQSWVTKANPWDGGGLRVPQASPFATFSPGLWAEVLGSNALSVATAAHALNSFLNSLQAFKWAQLACGPDKAPKARFYQITLFPHNTWYKEHTAAEKYRSFPQGKRKLQEKLLRSISV